MSCFAFIPPSSFTKKPLSSSLNAVRLHKCLCKKHNLPSFFLSSVCSGKRLLQCSLYLFCFLFRLFVYCTKPLLITIPKANRDPSFSGSVIFIFESSVSHFCDTWHNDLLVITDPLRARGCHFIVRLALFVSQVCRKEVNHIVNLPPES